MTDDPRFEELGDVEHLAHDDDEAEEDVWEPVQLEPAMATRNSPYAVAALVVALLSAFPLVQTYVNLGVIFDLSPLTATRVVRTVVGLVPVIAFAAAAFWLAGRADEEIYVAEGRLGGVGYTRAARVIAAISAIGLSGVITVHMFVRSEPSDFGINSRPAEFQDDSDSFDVPPP